MVNKLHFDDLTKIDKPFDELDDATKGALLLAAYRGEVIERLDTKAEIFCPTWFKNIVYRVRPKPVIGEVVMFASKAIGFHILSGRGFSDRELKFTFPTRDGLHVPGIYTSPEGLQIKIEVGK